MTRPLLFTCTGYGSTAAWALNDADKAARAFYGLNSRDEGPTLLRCEPGEVDSTVTDMAGVGVRHTFSIVCMFEARPKEDA